MKEKSIFFRLGENLFNRLEGHCKKYGADKSKVIRLALEKFLNEIENKRGNKIR